jgi:hypothetical protein
LGRDAVGDIYGLMTGGDRMWGAPYMFAVHKFSSEGSALWQYTVDTSVLMPPFRFWSVNPTDAVVTSAGETYVTVGVEGLVKFDTDGHLVWNVAFTPPHPTPIDIWGVEHTAVTALMAVAVDEAGNVWVAGWSDGVIDGETNGTEAGPILLRVASADGAIEAAHRVAEDDVRLRPMLQSEAFSWWLQH